MAFIEDYALIGDCEQRTEPRTLTGSRCRTQPEMTARYKMKRLISV